MLNAEQIDEWRGQDVLDRAGEKIGRLDEVFYDVGSGKPAFVSVKSGMLGRHNRLVALNGATVSREYLRVAYTAADVDAVEVDEADGQLDIDGVRRAAVAYGIAIDADARFESATLLQDRREYAAEVAARAAELEADAARLAQEAEVARGRAADAAQMARQAEEDRDAAHRAAMEARIEAERVANGTPPPVA